MLLSLSLLLGLIKSTVRILEVESVVVEKLFELVAEADRGGATVSVLPRGVELWLLWPLHTFLDREIQRKSLLTHPCQNLVSRLVVVKQLSCEFFWGIRSVRSLKVIGFLK